MRVYTASLKITGGQPSISAFAPTARHTDHAGLTARAAADQLGLANTCTTTDVYFGRKIATTGAAAVLEALGR